MKQGNILLECNEYLIQNLDTETLKIMELMNGKTFIHYFGSSINRSWRRKRYKICSIIKK